jgi:hypothetical protein
MTAPSKSALEKARAALTKLLDALELSEVVLVDDEALDVRLALAKKLPALSKGTYLETLKDPGAYTHDGHTDWMGERHQKERELIASQRRERIASHPNEVSNSIEVLAYMSGERFRPMTPEAWKALETNDRRAIAESSLVLFDRQLGDGIESGDELLRDFLDEFREAYGAILTNEVKAEEEIDAALASAHAQSSGATRADPARSLVASKERLMIATPIDFVEDLRITRAAPPLTHVRDQLIKVAQTAHAAAVTELKETIDLRTLEHIMVRAARNEGSWEADALLRVLAIVYRSNAQELLLDEPMLTELAQRFGEVRTIFARTGDPYEQAKLKAADLMKRERYDPGPLINTAGLPLTCGDLFEIRVGPEGTAPTLWMLLEQPCDLQLRDDTNSRKRIASTELIAVRQGKPPKERTYPLPSGSRHCEPSEQLYLMLNSRLAIPFEVLELCVFETGGRCHINASAEQPLTVPQTPALLRRWHELRHAHETTLRLALISEDLELRQRIIGHYGAIDPEQENVVQWPITRVERLNEPHAQPALRAATEDRSRFAFDPDLAGG